jgi:hypothetical protein
MFGEKQNYKAKHKFNNKSEGLHLLPFCVSAYVEDVISHYRLTASGYLNMALFINGLSKGGNLRNAHVIKIEQEKMAL